MLAQTIMSCLEGDPGKRPESAEAFLKLIAKVEREFEGPMETGTSPHDSTVPNTAHGSSLKPGSSPKVKPKSP